jgi:long-chain acyl-CoA synthetase
LLPADLVDKMKARRVTSMIAVPALYRTLKKTIESAYPRTLSHLIARFVPIRALRRLIFFALHRLAGGHVRRFISGGSPLDSDTLAFFERLGAPIYQGYGLTETAPVITVNAPGAAKFGSVGRPLPGTEVTIGEGGEILVRGPQLMLGYYKAPELTREAIDRDGWFHTGDLGRLENGFLYVTGRIKDLIVPADGRKVHPDEVEAVLSRSSKVKELCVIGLPSERGEEVCAVVVPSEGVAEQDVEKELQELARDLRDFKRPRRIIVRRTELPRTRTMKVRRSEVQSWVQGTRT